MRTLLDHEVDGLLVSTAPFGANQFNALLERTPCVFIDELAPGAGAGNVALENGHGVELLVEHLAEHGHERIAFLGGPEDRTSGHERYEGFVTGMNSPRPDARSAADQGMRVDDRERLRAHRGTARRGVAAHGARHRQR